MSNKKAVKTISLLWLASLLGAGCAFLTQVLLARGLGPAAFGVFAATLSIVSLVAPLASFGVGGFWLKVFGQEGWLAVNWLRSSFVYSLLTTIFVLLALFFWATFGPHDTTVRALLMILSFYVLGQVSVELINAKLQLEESYIALALWQLLPHLLRLLSVVMLGFVMIKWMTLNNIAYLYAIISIAIFGFCAFYLWGMYNGKFALKGHGSASANTRQSVLPYNIKQVVAQSWPFGLAGTFYMIYFQSDIIFLKYMKGDETAGIYSVAFVFMVAVYMLPSVIYQKFLLPKIHRWANQDRARFYRVYRTGNWVMLILGLFAMLTVWLLAPFAVSLLFGDSYIDAVSPLRILALAVPLRFVATSVGATLVTHEHMRKKVFFMAVVALVNIILNLKLIPNYGMQGAAIATVISDCVLLFLYLYSASYHVFSEKN